MPRAMTIGQLAEAAGVGVETIRYYQRRGILATPSKPMGGHRQYPESALKHLAFVRRGQQLGFSLDEIVVLMGLREGAHWAEGRQHAQKKLDELGDRVAELNRMRKELKSIISRYDADKRRTSSPLIRALDGEG